MINSLTLSQKIYLLGIHPRKGGIISTAYTAMDYCLLGTLFLELYQKKKIRFVNKRIDVIDSKSDNELHRFLLEKLKQSKKNLRISTWINKFYFSLKFIRKEIQQQLADKRIIKIVPKRFLVFSWRKPYLLHNQVIFNLISEIEQKCFGNPSTEDDVFLLTFIKPTGLLRRVFNQKEKRKQANKRLKMLMKENQVSITVSDSISAAKAVVASVSSTVASHQTVA